MKSLFHRLIVYVVFLSRFNHFYMKLFLPSLGIDPEACPTMKILFEMNFV